MSTRVTLGAGCYWGTEKHIKDAFLRIPWWLALLELEALGHRFGEDGETELPCRFSGLVRLIRRTRQERPEATVRNKLETSDAIAAALMASARFHHKLSGHDMCMHAFVRRPSVSQARC